MVRRPHLVTTKASTITLHHSLNSVLGGFFSPLRTSDSRTDFYTMYHKESRETGCDYARKLDEDLNTSLIFVSRLISAPDAEH